ncbi:MAG: hypothetical protein B7Y99_02765 [Caulobacterales bacterium 32-69-10]|nr:MAG: hypothetical protein B7Y99_02765 [Caulobacterales bacterium 32-69-10]
MTPRRLLLAGLALVAIAPSPGFAASSPVEVRDAWCRAAPVGALAGGCFVTLTARADDRLVAVETPAADHGEIHTMSMTDGVMRMRRLIDGLDLPAGKAVALRPGAEHLMIIGPKAPLAAGGTVRLTLRFAKAPPAVVTAPVRSAPTPGAMSGMGHH